MTQIFPYQNKELTIRERTEDLYSRLTLKEKVGQLNQHLYGWKCFKKQNGQFMLTDYFKKHIKWGGGLGALYGVLRADPWSQITYENGIPAQQSKAVINQIQRYVIHHSRLGIPALIVEEAPHGQQGLDTISYPTNIGKGNMFNSDLIMEMAHHQAQEMSQKGINLALVSTLDLAKDPRWGRFEECFGEDPYLSARYTSAVIKGFQNDLISDHVDFRDQKVRLDNSTNMGVVIKHLIGQGDVLGGHNSGTVPLGRREFMDVYLNLIRSTKNAVGVMAAYNDLDSIPCHANKQLLTKLLRSKIGFQGLVMADGVALDKLKDLYPSDHLAALSALAAGVDLSLWDSTYTQLESAISEFPEAMEYLELAVKRVLSIKFLLGLFDKSYDDDSQPESDCTQNSEKCNLEIARQSITMVKNDNMLPLANRNSRILVVGPNANNVYNQLGDYTAPQTEARLSKTIYKEIKLNYPNTRFTQGSEVRTEDLQELADAKRIAQEFDPDIVICCLGGSSTRDFSTEFLANGAAKNPANNMDSGENIDLASLLVGGNQMALLREMSKLGKKIITIMIQGRPYEISDIEQLSDAVLIGWYPGQEGARAIAEILSGQVNPSGKLSISYPRSSMQLPVYYYQRVVMKNDDYFDMKGSPLHKFGYGLHYGKVKYSNLHAYFDQENGYIKVRVSLTNDSMYNINETVLVYAGVQGMGILPRKPFLVGFTKKLIGSNNKTEVELTITLDSLRYTNQNYDFILPSKTKIYIDDMNVTIDLNDKR